jgi:hypothetical protein
VNCTQLEKALEINAAAANFTLTSGLGWLVIMINMSGESGRRRRREDKEERERERENSLHLVTRQKKRSVYGHVTAFERFEWETGSAMTIWGTRKKVEPLEPNRLSKIQFNFVVTSSKEADLILLSSPRSSLHRLGEHLIACSPPEVRVAANLSIRWAIAHKLQWPKGDCELSSVRLFQIVATRTELGCKCANKGKSALERVRHSDAKRSRERAICDHEPNVESALDCDDSKMMGAQQTCIVANDGHDLVAFIIAAN